MAEAPVAGEARRQRRQYSTGSCGNCWREPRCWYLGSPRAHGDLCSHRSRLHWRLCGLSVQGGFIAITANPYGANGTSSSTSARGGSMTESARSEDSMGCQPRSMPRRYKTHGAARCAPANGLAGCYVSTIGKPHEYFDLTGSRYRPRARVSAQERSRQLPPQLRREGAPLRVGGFCHAEGCGAGWTGHLGIIPGSMGARSYIVRGKGNRESFESCSHGAGRVMSRNEAKERFTLDDHAAAKPGRRRVQKHKRTQDSPGLQQAGADG